MKRVGRVNSVPLRIDGGIVIDPSAQGGKIVNRDYRLAATARVLPAVGSFFKGTRPYGMRTVAWLQKAKEIRNEAGGATREVRDVKKIGELSL